MLDVISHLSAAQAASKEILREQRKVGIDRSQSGIIKGIITL